MCSLFDQFFFIGHGEQRERKGLKEFFLFRASCAFIFFSVFRKENRKKSVHRMVESFSVFSLCAERRRKEETFFFFFLYHGEKNWIWIQAT